MISNATIQAVSHADFDVYMRTPKDTWLIFTDGTRIGYLQQNEWRGLSISTVHIPNTSSGTGYGVHEGLSDSDLTAEKLNNAFIHAPHWAREPRSVRKWKDFAAFKAANSFNAAYELVAARASSVSV